MQYFGILAFLCILTRSKTFLHTECGRELSAVLDSNKIGEHKRVLRGICAKNRGFFDMDCSEFEHKKSKVICKSIQRKVDRIDKVTKLLGDLGESKCLSLIDIVCIKRENR